MIRTGIWEFGREFGMPFNVCFFFKPRRSCYYICFRIHLLFVIKGLKIKQCAKNSGDQFHLQHVFLNYSAISSPTWYLPLGMPFWKWVSILREEPWLQEQPLNFEFSTSTRSFFERKDAQWPPPEISHSLVAQLLKNKSVDTAVKMRSCISNYSFEYSHTAITWILPKRRFHFLFVWTKAQLYEMGKNVSST